MRDKNWKKIILMTVLFAIIIYLTKLNVVQSVLYSGYYLLLAGVTYVVGRRLGVMVAQSRGESFEVIEAELNTFLIVAPTFGFLITMQKGLFLGVTFGILIGLIVSGLNRLGKRPKA